MLDAVARTAISNRGVIPGYVATDQRGDRCLSMSITGLFLSLLIWWIVAMVIAVAIRAATADGAAVHERLRFRLLPSRQASSGYIRT